jgi:hypothetical protein
VSQLPLVYMDDCFITLCPERPVLPEDPPSFPAPCAPVDTPAVASSGVVPGLSGGNATPKPPRAACVGVRAGAGACFDTEPLAVLALTVLTLVVFLVLRQRAYAGAARTCLRRFFCARGGVGAGCKGGALSASRKAESPFSQTTAVDSPSSQTTALLSPEAQAAQASRRGTPPFATRKGE